MGKLNFPVNSNFPGKSNFTGILFSSEIDDLELVYWHFPEIPIFPEILISWEVNGRMNWFMMVIDLKMADDDEGEEGEEKRLIDLLRRR